MQTHTLFLVGKKRRRKYWESLIVKRKVRDNVIGFGPLCGYLKVNFLLFIVV
jgi:hypothetical protein